ncbi:MAG TPA: chemotaxis protein CheA [Syntrophorhabdaceae bacterium]|nr:chemotaxis protein CheA [Syntrophorhabdaceae bacterium]
MNDKHGEAFREEAYELLSELEGSLLELEETPSDPQLIGRVFRVMHTIKGSGAMFGFDDIAAFTHEIENVYDKVRSGELNITKQLIDLTLKSRDLIKLMLDGEAPEKTILEETVAAFKTTTSPPTPTGASPFSPLHEMSSGESVTYRIRFEPAPGIFLNGTNPVLLLDELRELGECVVTAQLDQIQLLDCINPEYCYVWWDIVLTTSKGTNAIKDVFIFVEDQCKITIEPIEREADVVPAGSARAYKKIGEILVDRGDVRQEDVQYALKEKKYVGQLLVEKGLTTAEKVESALVEQRHIQKMREKAQVKEEGISSLRVPSEKLDVLVNLVGELVTAQARLTQTASTLANSNLVSIAEEIERLTAELRDNTLNIRMLPIGSTFARFKRLIRDLSRELGKEIEMTTEGEETELDKTVIEKLNDPLVHLIRNCIDHGIETPDLRERLGKRRTGRIRLSAAHSGAHVEIVIEDDGGGLDKSAILAKAYEKGLVSPGQELTDRELLNLIFAPGFSTAKKVTNVSGRGVGMDVVKSAIDVLRGTIDIASEEGRGTTVLIRLPLTLAIIEGLIVTLGGRYYILPLSIVEECVELTEQDARKSHGRNLAHIRGDLVPYVRLRKEFDIPGEAPPIEQIVITGCNGEKVGLVVDKVIGEHQTVIKNLGRCYRDVDAVSGATILGDGTVALIVDTAKVIKNAERAEAAR